MGAPRQGSASGAVLCGAAAALAMLGAGCVSVPATGRVRDAHLLWRTAPEERAITSVAQSGPFHERVAAASGAGRVSLRPFLYTAVTDTNQAARRVEILWPFGYASNRRGDALSWRFLLFFGKDGGTGKTAADGRPVYNTWLFPFWFQGRSRQGDDYAALWPFYGTIRDIWWERVQFTAFPLWVEYDRAGFHSWSVLWPFVSRTTGGGGSGFKVFPFYGQMDKTGGDFSRFALWPLWTDAEHRGRNPGSSWMLWPLAGRVERESQSSLMLLPPLFNFTKGKGRLSYLRNYSFPWPLMRIVDGKGSHRRRFWPFYAKRWRDDGKAGATSVLWPVYNRAFVKTNSREQRSLSLFPFYFHSEIFSAQSGAGAGEGGAITDGGVWQGADSAARAMTLEEDFTRIWPFYSKRGDPANSFMRIPDFGFSKRESPLERNLLDAFTLYTRGGTRSPRQVAHSALWGLVQRRRGEVENGALVWPFWSSSEADGAWRWSFLGGLLGREKSLSGIPPRWRFFWFF